MIFNSIYFLLFFTVVFLIYYFILQKNISAQNIFLLLMSYAFYAMADWKMIPLLLTSTLIFYFLGIIISNSKSSKRSYWITTLGVILGIVVLLYFKYFNFFIESFSQLFNTIGLKTDWSTFSIIMPLGISFFTFKLISYVVEIYRGKLEATKDFVAFATYIAFFPTIMSGPIDRPNLFLPQLKKKRIFDYDLTVDGSKQVLWGLFKKMVIADNIANVVNNCWSDVTMQNGSTLLIVSLLFTLQLYADFSGYSDMAIGVAKMLGFKVATNFNYPFFGRNIAEYWRNWHISLTSWLTDYVFMPLNIQFRTLGVWGSLLAINVTFILIGLWHGANWTFVLFGVYHGLLYIPLILSGAFFKKNKLKANKFGLPILTDLLKMLFTFLLFSFGLILFRAPNVYSAIDYFIGLFDISIFAEPKSVMNAFPPFLLSILMLIFEWFNKEKEFALQFNANPIKKWSVYIVLVILIFYYQGVSADFIYFKF